MTKEEQYLQSGAYALDALSPDERASFERALVDSPELATEVDELQATALLLGLAATPVEPSPDLKSRLMAQIAQTAQTPDVATPVRDAAPVRLQNVASTPERDDTPVHDTATPFVASTAAEHKARSRWFSRPVGTLVAAAAAVALFVGGGAVATQFLQNNSSQSSEQASESSLAEIYAASDVQTVHSAITGGGAATVLWAPSIGKSAVVAQGLPSLPSDKTYQAWYINGTVVTPAGTFTPGGDATTWHVLTGTLSSGDTVGVTVEPAGGSQSPTTTPILMVAA